MDDAAHHVSCVTFTGDDVVTFLHDIMGLNVPNPGASAPMLGSGSRARGYTTSEIKTFNVNENVALSCATVTAGDLTFELVKFNAL
jgi:hypothetical protein